MELLSREYKHFGKIDLKKYIDELNLIEKEITLFHATIVNRNNS